MLRRGRAPLDRGGQHRLDHGYRLPAVDRWRRAVHRAVRGRPAGLRRARRRNSPPTYGDRFLPPASLVAAAKEGKVLRRSNTRYRRPRRPLLLGGPDGAACCNRLRRKGDRMSEPLVLVDRDGALATVTFNVPDRRNVLSFAMIAAISRRPDRGRGRPERARRRAHSQWPGVLRRRRHEGSRRTRHWRSCPASCSPCCVRSPPGPSRSSSSSPDRSAPAAWASSARPTWSSPPTPSTSRSARPASASPPRSSPSPCFPA